MTDPLSDRNRIVITGVGLASPNGNNLKEFRQSLLEGRSGVVNYETRYMGGVLAGVCRCDVLRYQKKKDLRRGTRAGSLAIYCANEAVVDGRLDWGRVAKERVGIFIGITEHGNVETENEIYEISGVRIRHASSGPITIIPARWPTIRPARCQLTWASPARTHDRRGLRGGNAGLIQGVQMLRLGEVDVALAGGVSESIHTFGIFASFKSQGALAEHDDPPRPRGLSIYGATASSWPKGAACTC